MPDFDKNGYRMEPESISSILKRFMLLRGHSLKHVSNHCGVSVETVKRWRDGGDPEVQNLEKLFTLYKTDFINTYLLRVNHYGAKPVEDDDTDSIPAAVRTASEILTNFIQKQEGK